jgi:hypothetical protein
MLFIVSIRASVGICDPDGMEHSSMIGCELWDVKFRSVAISEFTDFDVKGDDIIIVRLLSMKALHEM